MSKILTAAALGAAFAARYPNPGGLTLAASGEEDSVEKIEAAATVKGFAAVSGKLVWLRATEHFSVKGEPVLIGTYVQLPANEARIIIEAQRAVAATDDEVARARAEDGE